MTLTAHIAEAKVRVQVDVGFGDAITPDAIEIDFPALLSFPAPRLRAYPRETVIAEKLDAMVQLGLANSRMKDFYDLRLLSELFDFDGELLVKANSSDVHPPGHTRSRGASRRAVPAICRRLRQGEAVVRVRVEVRRW